MERLTERKWKSNTVEPLPCPCCESTKTHLQETNGPSVEIYCQDCGLTTGRRASATIAMGIWNRRPTQYAPDLGESSASDNLSTPAPSG